MKKQAEKPQYVALLGAVSLALAYAVGSRAIWTGSYWQYVVCILLFVAGVKLLVRSFKKYYGRK